MMSVVTMFIDTLLCWQPSASELQQIACKFEEQHSHLTFEKSLSLLVVLLSRFETS
jgi:hypothetical protein